MDTDEIPRFFLFIKFDFFHRTDVNLVIVTNTIIFLSTSLKLIFFFTRENNTVIQSKPAFCLSFIVDILLYTSINVTTVFGPDEMNTKLRYLRFGRFIDIHIMRRTLHGFLGIRI